MRTQLKETEDAYNNLMTKIVSLKGKFKKSIANMKFEKSSATLDEILICQRLPFYNTSLVFDKKENTVKEGSKYSQ